MWRSPHEVFPTLWWVPGSRSPTKRRTSPPSIGVVTWTRSEWRNSFRTRPSLYEESPCQCDPRLGGCLVPVERRIPLSVLALVYGPQRGKVVGDGGWRGSRRPRSEGDMDYSRCSTSRTRTYLRPLGPTTLAPGRKGGPSPRVVRPVFIVVHSYEPTVGRPGRRFKHVGCHRHRSTGTTRFTPGSPERPNLFPRPVRP